MPLQSLLTHLSKIRAVFIRAPIAVVKGDNVEVLAKLSESEIVALRQGKILATSFHPELTSDTRWHQYFAKMVEEAISQDNSKKESD